MNRSLKVFYGKSNPKLAKDICSFLRVQPGRMTMHAFSNENIKVKIEENVRNDDVYVIQTASPPVHRHLVELLILIDALRYASAGRITAVMPYYFYARSDKKDEPRISITARLVAELLESAGADRILCMTLHAPQIMGFTRIPIDQLLATGLLLSHYQRRDLSNTVVAAPDIGSAKGSKMIASALKMPLVIIDKDRLGDQEKVSTHTIIGDAADKDILLVDDEILTGGSILQAAKSLKEQGARNIYACCTHGFFSRDALEKLQQSDIEEIVSTNTLPVERFESLPKFKILCVAELFANAIQAIHNGDSVGALFPEMEK